MTYVEACAQYRRDIELLEAEEIGFASAKFAEKPLTYSYSDHEVNDRAVLGWQRGKLKLAMDKRDEAALTKEAPDATPQ